MVIKEKKIIVKIKNAHFIRRFLPQNDLFQNEKETNVCDKEKKLSFLVP